MTTKPTYSLDELAAVLGRTPGYLRSGGRKRLEARGFPPPLPGLGLLWSRAAVDGWIAANGHMTATPAGATDPDHSAAARAALEAAYGGRRP